MDDASKIAVLMIYYQHWGKDEIRARKTLYGMKQTLKILGDDMITGDKTLEYELKRRFAFLFENEDTYYMWTEIVDILLQDFGGCFETIWKDGLYNEEDMLLDRKILLEDNLGDVPPIDLIYDDDDFGYKEILSVDAIVALPVITPLDDELSF